MSFYQKLQPRKKHQIISDINITPFVDVLLVLLIIFMVAAPMISSVVDVDLPKGVANQTDNKNPISISIKSNYSIFLQENLITLKSLSSKLLKTANNNLNSRVFIRADKNLDYGKVMEVVRIINLTGFNKVSLVTENQ